MPIFFILPFLIGLFLISRSSLFDAVGIVFAYLAVEGAFKLFSDYNTLLRIAIDLMIMSLFYKMYQLKMSRQLPGKIFNAPHSVFFFIHVGWILVQFLNPYALGLIPSLAGYKVYISALLLYFITYSAIEKKEQLEILAFMAVVLVFIQVTLSAYQFSVGESFLLSWSPYYGRAMGIRFRGLYFRPFGTSNVVAGGTTLIFLLTPIAIGFLLKKLPRAGVFICGIFIAAIAYVLFISQVRAAMVKTAIGLGTVLLALSTTRSRNSILGFIGVVAVVAFLGQFADFNDKKFKMAEARLMQMTDAQDVWEKRSSGTNEATFRVLEEMPMGIGLSRVGAASEPFKHLIEADTIWGPMWAFADSLFKAVLTEIGIPGLLFYLLFLSITFGTGILGIIRSSPNRDDYVYFQAGAIGAILGSISGFAGSEGFLYQPECTVTWIFVGSLVKINEMLKRV